MKPTSVKNTLDKVGLGWVTMLLVGIMSGLIYTVPALWQTWEHEGTTLVTEIEDTGKGFVAGHDFVAFYSASQIVSRGYATGVYDHAYMEKTQHELVGDTDVGFLAFMYPPTYLLIVWPLSSVGYFPALTLWLAVPLGALLIALYRGIAIPPVALLLVVTAPSVGQALFAGQNGLLFAALVTAGAILQDRRPFLAGIFFGLATAKPQLAVILFPALLSGRRWKILLAACGTIVAMIGLATLAFGAEIWSAYASMPLQAREWLATGRLPWPRMPTIYVAARLAGLSDAGAMLAQTIGILFAIAGLVWVWRQEVSTEMRSASLLAAIPLATPFLYDYDLPFMLTAAACFLAHALHTGWIRWERTLLFIVWLQPVWWWTLSATVFEFSVAPLVYGLFFLAVLRRVYWTDVSTKHPSDYGASDAAIRQVEK